MEWMNNVLNSIKLRNEIETEPFIHIYRSYDSLWQKSLYHDNRREEIQHHIATIEYDVSNYSRKMDSSNGKHVVENVLNDLDRVQTKLKPFDTKTRSERSSSSRTEKDLSWLVFDQQRLLIDQREEIAMAKTELRATLERAINCETDLQAESEARGKFESANTELEMRVIELEKENKELIARVMMERGKAAEELNKLNDLSP